MPYAIFVNDNIIEETGGHISPLDRGFLYGDGLFETLRVYEKRPFRLEEHIIRLSNSAHYFDIPFPYSSQQIRHIIDQLILKNNLANAYVRVTLSRGLGADGLIPSERTRPTLIIHTRPLTAYALSLYATGISLITSHIRRSATCPLSRHKTLNFLTNYLIKKEAIAKGAHDALILNTDGHVAECTVSNFFIVEKNTIITPSINANILPGITRKIILELCRKNTTCDAIEKLFELERVFEADEIFVTNSLMEIMPVSKINGQPVGKLVPGSVTKFLQEEYRNLTHQY